MHSNKGFSLIELMVTVGIISILTAIALPVYDDYILKVDLTKVFYEDKLKADRFMRAYDEGGLDTLASEMASYCGAAVIRGTFPCREGTVEFNYFSDTGTEHGASFSLRDGNGFEFHICKPWFCSPDSLFSWTRFNRKMNLSADREKIRKRLNKYYHLMVDYNDYLIMCHYNGQGNSRYKFLKDGTLMTAEEAGFGDNSTLCVLQSTNAFDLKAAIPQRILPKGVYQQVSAYSFIISLD